LVAVGGVVCIGVVVNAVRVVPPDMVAHPCIVDNNFPAALCTVHLNLLLGAIPRAVNTLWYSGASLENARRCRQSFHLSAIPLSQSFMAYLPSATFLTRR